MSEEQSELTNAERHARAFRPGGPDVMISGFDVWRAALSQTSGQRVSEETEVSWRLTVLATGSSEPSLFVLGDLQCELGDYFVGCIAVAFIDFRDRRVVPADDVDQANELAAVLGPWVSPALYDFAAARARDLASMSMACKIEVPILTPEPQYGVPRREGEAIVVEEPS